MREKRKKKFSKDSELHLKESSALEKIFYPIYRYFSSNALKTIGTE